MQGILEMDASNPKSDGSGNRIRAILLWPVALVSCAAVAMIFLFPAKSQPPAKSQTESSAPADMSNSTVSDTRVVHAGGAHGMKPSVTEPETERLAGLMLDKSLPQAQRRQAAKALARIGTDEAMASIKAALTLSDTPPYVKAAIAEGLGESPNPDARELLHSLANDKNETLARAAERGLALRGDDDAVNTLGGLLFNEQTALSVRTEAALALGDVNLQSAQDLLTRAVSQIQDEDVVESVLDGLGRRPFDQTEEFFRNYLNSPNVSPAYKVLAIESITDADGDVLSFLTSFLNDPNPDVREAAKEAVDFLE